MAAAGHAGTTAERACAAAAPGSDCWAGPEVDAAAPGSGGVVAPGSRRGLGPLRKSHPDPFRSVPLGPGRTAAPPGSEWRLEAGGTTGTPALEPRPWNPVCSSAALPQAPPKLPCGPFVTLCGPPREHGCAPPLCPLPHPSLLPP